MESKEKQISKDSSGKKISRKEAIKKAGVTALAATSLVFLKTNSASACSCPNHGGDCGNPVGGGGGFQGGGS